MNCRTQMDKEAYLELFQTREGIELDPAELDKGLNPALRQISVIFFLKKCFDTPIIKYEYISNNNNK
jgi:hypothetical protein